MNKFTAFACCVLSLATVSAVAGEPYLLINYQSGGVSVAVDYGCGQRAALQDGGHPLYLQTNQVEQGVNLTLELDRRNSERAAAAIAHLRAIAPPIVAANPCPQPAVACTTGYCGRTVCAPVAPAYGPAIAPAPAVCTTGYCGRTYCAPVAPAPAVCTTGYCGRPICTPGIVPVPAPLTARATGYYGRVRRGYCGRVPCTCGYCAGYAAPVVPAARPGYCGRVPCTCGYCAGHAAVPVVPVGGSCCSGRGDGRNPMVLYPPGDPRGVCWCAQNANGPGHSCACPPNCPQCNPGHVIGYGG